jgi:hypothetical protein
MNGDGSREHSYLGPEGSTGDGAAPARQPPTGAGASPVAARGPSLRTSEQGRAQARAAPATGRLDRSHKPESGLRPPPAVGAKDGAQELCRSFGWRAPAPAAGLLDLCPSPLCRMGSPTCWGGPRLLAGQCGEGAGDGEGRREGCERQMRERESMEGEGREVEED